MGATSTQEDRSEKTMELSNNQKRIIDNVKDSHRRVEEAKVVLETNRYYDTVVDTEQRHLNKYLERAAEAEIPSEMIAEATSYRPVSKLKQEISFLQGRCEALEGAAESLSKEVLDLRAEVTRVNAACKEIDEDAEAHALRMERVALISALITFVVGVAFGLLV